MKGNNYKDSLLLMAVAQLVLLFQLASGISSMPIILACSDDQREHDSGTVDHQGERGVQFHYRHVNHRSIGRHAHSPVSIGCRPPQQPLVHISVWLHWDAHMQCQQQPSQDSRRLPKSKWNQV